MIGDGVWGPLHHVPFNEVNTIYIMGTVPAEVSRSVCPPDTCPWGWGPLLCAQGLLHEPRGASQSPIQVTLGIRLQLPCAVLLCRCLCLGHPLSLLDSLATRLCFSLAPLCLGGPVVVERTRLGTQTESSSERQLCHSHRLGGS